METTYMVIKPDGVQRGLVGTYDRFERKGCTSSASNRWSLMGDRSVPYAVHEGRPFYEGLIDSSPADRSSPWLGRARMPSQWLDPHRTHQRPGSASRDDSR